MRSGLPCPALPCPLYLLTSLVNVGHKLAHNIPSRIVGTYDNHLATARLTNPDAQLLRSLPHHLRKLTSLDGTTRFRRKRVLLYLLVPGSTNVPCVGSCIPIRGPETIEILSVLGVLSIGEPIIAGQYFCPLLGIPYQLLVQAV